MLFPHRPSKGLVVTNLWFLSEISSLAMTNDFSMAPSANYTVRCMLVAERLTFNNASICAFTDV